MPASAPRRPPASADAPPPHVRVVRQFRMVFNAMKAHFRAVEKSAGLAGAQVWALSVVQAQPGCTVKHLSQAMDIHQSTASNLLKTLTEGGLVGTTRDEADRRIVHLHLLPAGQRVLRRAPAPLTGVLPEALAGLDPRTLGRLESDLAELLKALKTDPRSGRVPLGQ